MADVHNKRSKKTLESVLLRIQGLPVERIGRGTLPLYDEPVPEPNRSLLLGFYRSLLTEDMTVGRRAVLMGNMYRASIWSKHKPFPEMTRDDIIELLAHVKGPHPRPRVDPKKQTPYSLSTTVSYTTSLKKFWRWMKNPGVTSDVLKDLPNPPEVSWIRHKKKRNALLPRDIWTPEEVNKAAMRASCERDRAFVLGLFGSGCRIGEFLPLKRSDISFDEHSAQIHVSGKTGSRRVRLTPAASVALATWLDVHPNKDSDAPVWINIHLRRPIPTKPLSYDWAREMLKELARRAGINKHLNPHLMRHSLATYYAPRLTEAVMNEHFGWRQGGQTAATYTHLSGKQVDDQILAVFGKKKVDSPSHEEVDVINCNRCGLTNTSSTIQCGKCGFPLTEEAARELHDRRQKADQLMDALVSNPEVMKLMKKILDQSESTWV